MTIIGDNYACYKKNKRFNRSFSNRTGIMIITQGGQDYGRAIYS